MVLSRRLPLLLAVTALAAALALVPGRAESADWNARAAATAPLWVGPTTATVEASAASVSGHVDPRSTTEVWFEYGPTTAYGSRTVSRTVRLGPAPMVETRGTLPGLRPGAAYHVRLVARDDTGRVVGPDTRLVAAPAQG